MKNLLEKLKKNFPEALKWWLLIILPVAAIVLSIFAIQISSEQSQLAQRIHELITRHYYEIEEPALKYQHIFQDLIMLDDRIEEAEQGIAESEMPEDVIAELEQIVSLVKHYRAETQEALRDNRLTDAEKAVDLAHESVIKVLLELSNEVPYVTIKVEGFLAVEIDNLTTGRTREGKPLETIIISKGDSPTLFDDSYRVVASYDISPNGAKLDSPATFILSYDREDIPLGYYEDNLVVAMLDCDTGQWNILDGSDGSIVNLQQQTISVKADQLTSFAVLAQPLEISQPIGLVKISLISTFSLVGFSLLVLAAILITKRRQRPIVKPLTCKRCEHQWFPKVPSPKQCPKCHSKRWND